MRHIIPISGKDSLVTALVQTTLQPNLSYEFLFNDTECELPEVYAWLEKVRVKTGWNITVLGKNLEEVIYYKGGFLPSIHTRFCTMDSKIKPMDKYLKGSKATIYYGLRADEDRIGYIPNNSSNIVPKYPLRERGITLPLVYLILDGYDLQPPDFFWQRLHDSVLNKLPQENLLPQLERWQFKTLFAGRSRSNCYFCFFQRQSEFLWLYEAHPNLFEKARNFEKTEYTWLKDCPLSSYDNKDFRDKVFERRVNKTVKALLGVGKVTVDSEINRTSCGLLCGK